MKVLSDITTKIGEIFSPQSIETYVVALLIFVVGWVLARSLAKGVERFMRQQGSEHGAAVGKKVVFYVVLLLATFGALTQLGVKLTGLLTAAGIFTVAIGFAAQTSVSNVISGLFLLVDRPFSINDTVKIDQTIGTVVNVDLLSTKVRTFDNLVVRIPNEALLKSTITNYTLFEVRRIDIPVSVAYSTDLGEAQRVLKEVMRDHKAVLDEPEPAVLVELLADSGITLVVRAWVVRQDFITAKSELTQAIKEALEAAKIEIPFPQRVVHHVYGEPSAPAAPESPSKHVEKAQPVIET
ncbi:mechanosensitive ion channel family protein [Persicimonas caeni]|uniref:Mechanosensitive ion channel family protein n=1 Tax=Persicimonas caeni TaxID=2292766 RepID=A0A4Y6Q385_PERCE|nr:mechanosensitive ion channel family protein [Persicimonas caeni]QDG54465.1 mechanosensitive ion channel family protein [Persicimonas caeni]QED35686.1 mechanosensitive ion channel family protein [Persicimonas caeni]